MRSSWIRVATLFVAMTVLGVLVACNNPLQVGLGDKVDLNVPDVELTSHQAGQYLSGTVEFGGVFTDDFEISGISLSADGGETELSAATNPEDRTWTYALDTTAYPDGETELLITITDQSGKTIQKRVLYYFDNTAPLVMVKNPQAYQSNIYNGTITVRGESADRFGIDEVAIRILDETGEALSSFDLADGTNSWAFEFDSRLYADPAGTIRIQTRAKDRAGNESEVVLHYDDVLFRNGGAPITIEDVLRVASGTELDGVTITEADIADIQMENVPFQIDNDLDKPTISVLTPNNGQNIGGSIMVTGTAYDDDGIDRVEMRLDLNGDGDYSDAFNIDGEAGTTGTFETESTWETLSGTTLWTQVLNADGELYQVETGHQGRVVIQVRAVDINGLEGNPVEIAIRFDDTIPRVESLNYITGDYVGGTFTLTGSIQDDEGIDRVQISYDGGISYYDMFNRDQGTNDGSITENAANNFSMSKSINTANIPGQGAVTAAPLYLRLLVTDNADYQAITYLTLNVDNVYPTNDPDGFTADAMNIRGADALVQGTAEDAGAISGIESVDVYFVRGPDIFNFTTDGFEAAGSYDFGDGDGSVDYIPGGGTASDYLIQIDDPDELGNGDTGPLGDNDGFNESISLSGSTYTWYAEFDSTSIDDGAIEVHYVINDSAGNGNHYAESGFVKNNYPEITSLTVGTDLDFSGAVETSGDSEVFTYESPFTVRNHLYVGINASDSGPNNGIAAYEVRRASNDAVLSSVSADTISVSAETEGTTLDLYAWVQDNDGIEETYPFSVIIDNVDDVDPSITLNAITSGSVVDVDSDGTPDGHAEAAGESLHDNATADADVSGTIELTGTVSDNQRIRYLYMSIDSYDAGTGTGAQHLLAEWDDITDQLVETADPNNRFSIETQTLSSSGGHEISYRYEWNTAEIQNVAQNNRSISFEVEDFGTTTTNDVADTQVDVVPYISDLEIGLESGTLSYLQRSALGSYAVSYSTTETFRINGYNLNPGVGDVTVGTTQLTINAQDAAPYQWVDVRSDAANSGPLTVSTNGIDSINNSNDNGLTQASEAAEYYPDRTDDRYIAMWGIESHDAASGDDWSGMTEAVMKPNAGRTDMDWMYVNNGQDVYVNNTRLTNSWSIRGGDLARNDDGTLMWIHLHDMNWFSGQTAWDYYGSVQWGKDLATEAAAYNWHRAGTDRLALGNLSFNTDPNYPYNQVVMNRYRNLQLILDGGDTDTDNFAAYFDSAAESRSIVFWSFKTGSGLAAPDQVTGLAGGWDSNLEKFTNGNTGSDYPAGDYRVGLRTPFTGISRVEVTSGGADSEAFDMAWDGTNGILYIVYYDEADSELKLAYNLDPVGTPGTWTTRSTAIDSGAGLHVDAAIDPSGGIHIAYFDGANSNLKYAYLPAYNAADGDVVTRTVDALFTNGMYNSIVIRDFDDTAGTDYRPVISSFSLSYSGTRYALRVSWPQDAIGGIVDGANTSTGNYTGDWEVTAVPAATAPGTSATYVETDGTTAGQGQIIVGYNGSYIEEATLYSE